jgi:DNA-binding NarL/FixJ family response regulator
MWQVAPLLTASIKIFIYHNSRFDFEAFVVTVLWGFWGAEQLGWGSSGMVRILIGDDHNVVRLGLRALIEARSDFIICGEASNGRETVELALEQRPDIVVLDVSMSVLNGIDATKQIRKATPDTEVLIFTRHNDDDTVRAAITAGARGYVLRSESDEQIIKAISTLALHQAFYSSQVWDIRLDPTSDHSNGMTAPISLTGREREVVQLIAEGNSNKMVAKMLAISVKTVETHRSAAMHKLNIHSTADLVRYAVRKKLVEP